ncbi:MAG: methylmalonyl-CoA mutase [Deltaproteobacteria bacterium HGW-Deltaproteobacteria-14]|nr:MAG: methylmalonyl-CoA mutase [Deltaproteobacteria bacterium HGW-Deltaproteobacteria-14]
MIDDPLTLTDDFLPGSLDAWREQVERDLKGAPFDRLETELEEGIRLRPLYTAADLPDPGAPGVPGLAPFTRGARALGYAALGWDVRQVCDVADVDGARLALDEDLAGGATSALLGCDGATRRGLSDPRGDGLFLNSAADLATVLAGVDLSRTPLAFDAGATTPLLVAALTAVADARGVPRAHLSGDLGADPLAALARDGALPQGLEAAWDELAELLRFCHAELPGVRPLGVDAGPWHDAGATAVQEVGWAIAAGVTTLRALAQRGVDTTLAAKHLTFGLRTGTRFLLDVAKLRAARRLWARVLEVLEVPGSLRGMRIHTRTADRVLTQRDPWGNLLRCTIATFSSAIGGAGVISAAPYDRMLGPSDPEARRMARNTQRVLLDEGQLHRVVDPGGGSWALESLTDQVAEAAWAEFQRIEALGGMDRAVVLGHLAAALDAVEQRRGRAIARRKDPITGVSEFPNLSEAPVVRPGADVAAIGAKARARQADRDEGAAQAAIAAVPGGGFEALVRAAAAGASFHELAAVRWAGRDATRAAPLPRRRAAAPFEALRDRSDAHRDRTGARPRVFLANLGPVAAHVARSNWIRALFETGGFEAAGNDGFSDPAAAAAAFSADGATIAILCGSDASYAELGAPTAAALTAAGARVLVAGRQPADGEQALREAGVADFVYLGQDVLALLTAELDRVGVA